MLRDVLADSDSLTKLSDPAYRLWSHMIPRFDIEGRAEVHDLALAAALGKTFVARKWSLPKAARARREIAAAGEWIVYGDPGSEIAQDPHWHKHQNTYRGDEAASVLPPPPGWDDDRERAKYGRNVDGRPERTKSTRGEPAGNPRHTAAELEPELEPEQEGGTGTPSAAPPLAALETTDTSSTAQKVARALGEPVEAYPVQSLAREIRQATSGVDALDEIIEREAKRQPAERKGSGWWRAAVIGRARELAEGALDAGERSKIVKLRGSGPLASVVDGLVPEFDAAAKRRELEEIDGKENPR